MNEIEILKQYLLEREKVTSGIVHPSFIYAKMKNKKLYKKLFYDHIGAESICYAKKILKRIDELIEKQRDDKWKKITKI